MSEEHRCTEECIGQLEDIVARLQEEHQEDLRRLQQLEEALKQTEKQRDDFFYWAEELAAHGYNCTYGHEESSKFIPLAREYWSEMHDDIAALSSSTSEAPAKEEDAGE